MEDFTEALKGYTGCRDVELIDGAYHVRFSQHERAGIINIRTNAPNFTGIMSTTPAGNTQTFYLHRDGSELSYELECLPIVFCIDSRLKEGVNGEYQHWTKAGILHRENGPAYEARYFTPTGSVESIMNMYFVAGIRQRIGAPSLELYKDFTDEVTTDKKIIRTFGQAIFECTHFPEPEIPLDGPDDPRLLQSWPYVHRLSLKNGRMMLLNQDGKWYISEIAAKSAKARWELPEVIGSGVYPTRMEMDGYHELWDFEKFRTRKVKKVRSWWLKINEEDIRRMNPANARSLEFNDSKFDQSLREMMPRLGFVDRPFYDDAAIEMGILTDLNK